MLNTFRMVRLLGVASLAALSACASIVHGTQLTIPVTSVPTGQRVTLDGVEVGVTPAYVVLNRNASHVIGIGSDSTGERVSVTRHLSGWIFVNVFWMYGLPIFYDLATGGAYNFNL